MIMHDSKTSSFMNTQKVARMLIIPFLRYSLFSIIVEEGGVDLCEASLKVIPIHTDCNMFDHKH